MSRLREMLEELCPDGVEYKKLGEIAEIIRGNGLQKSDFVDSGVGCIHYGQIYTKYGAFADKTITYVTPELAKTLKTVSTGDLVVAITSENVEDVCKCVAWLGGDDIVTGGHAAIVKHKQNPKYLSYIFQTVEFFRQKRKYVIGTKVIEMSPKKLTEISIPVPPLAIQNEIVKLLDNFTELTAELTAELQLRKKQYSFYRDSLLNFSRDDAGVEWKTLGDIGSVCMCKRILKQQTNTESGVPFYKIGTFGKVADSYISKELFLEYKGKYSYPRKGEILISAAGTIGRTVVYDGAPAYFQDSNIVWIANDESLVLNRYLYYFYSLFPWRVADGGTIARLYNDQIRHTEIPIPPLETQAKIVSILDRFDALCHDLTQGLPAEIAARKKQYEYYRDKLLTFPRKDA